MVLDIYLGYMVIFNKFCIFQDLGYDVIFLIGDFIGMVGDLIGKNIICLFLMCEDVLCNVEMYKQ